MPARELPPELRRVLERAHEVEEAAQGTAQRRAAAAATTRLLIACLDAGWRVFELTGAVGLKRATAERRIALARAAGVDGIGLDVGAPPLPPLPRSRILAVPVEDREWLTCAEAAALAGVSTSTIPRWRRAGVLPHTDGPDTVRPLYLRADVLHVARQPRWRNGGVNLNQVPVTHRSYR